MNHMLSLGVLALAWTAAASHAQSLRGKVVGPDGKPCADVRVFLVDSSTSKIAQLHLQGTGQIRDREPLAHGQSNAKGQFAIDAAPMLTDSQYSLWIVGPRFADKEVPNLRRPEAGETDLGEIRVLAGAVVQGRVIATGTGSPIVGATVRIPPPRGGRVAPGREEGWVAVTDSRGEFAIRNAPAGSALITAVGENFALASGTVTLRRGAPFEKNFELGPGRVIRGVVRDAKGNPVVAARIIAQSGLAHMRYPKSLPAPILVALADGKGRFSLQGLAPDWPYRITTKATNYLSDSSMIAANDKVLTIELASCPIVRMKVTGREGAAVRKLRARLVHARSHQGITSFWRPVVVNGIGERKGLPVGNYCLDVRAEGYAPAISEPFTLAAGTTSPVVLVPLDEGGVLSGQVVDAAGKPVKGALVSPSFGANRVDNPLMRMFLSPEDRQHPVARTDAKGRYRIPLLRPGLYTVTVTREGYVQTVHGSVTIKQGAELEAGAVLRRGVRVSGVVRSEGKPAKVQLHFTGIGTQRTLKATSDTKGRFVLPKNIAPGRYTVMMAAATEKNPLKMMVELNKNKREVVVEAGGPQEFEFEFDIVKMK